MAVLRKHGQEIGRIEYISKTKAFFSDGSVLSNNGSGWKIHGKIKSDFTPLQAFTIAKDRHEKRLADSPCLNTYRKALFAATSLKNRWKLTTAMDLLGDDIDGIWSEVSDGYGDNLDLSVDEIAHLVSLRNLAIREAKGKNETES